MMKISSTFEPKQSDIIGRVPPQAMDVEMAVLGSMMIDKDAIGKVLEIFSDDTVFYKDAHRKIYNAILGLYDKNEPVDLVTLSAELTQKKLLEEVGGNYYLTDLVNSVASSANVEYHAKIVLEKSLLRKLINVSTAIINESFEGQSEVYDLLDRAEQEIFRLSENRLRRGFEPIHPILHRTFDAIERIHGTHGGVTGVPSGFKKLDELTGGFQPSDLIIIAGRPSMGKTSLALDIARNAAIDAKVGVGIFSLEMASHQIGQRMLCSEARVDAHKVRTGRLPDEEWPRLSHAVGILADSPIFIDDTAGLGVLELRAKARRLKSDKDVGLIIVDYLQLMQGPKNVENRQQEISQISRSLKVLAKELNIPIIALSQLSRAIEARTDKRPVLSDLRESGAIEQDADVVMFVHRQIYADGESKGGSNENIAEIIIGKQRNGPVGNAEIVFVKEYAKFEEVERYFDERSYSPPRGEPNF